MEDQHQKLVRESSVASVSSDMLDLEDIEGDNVVYELDEAPYDILGEHKLIGTIIVAKKGAQLPLTTSWKISEGVPVAVKFSVSRTLEVSVADERPRKLKVNQFSNESPREKTIGAKQFRAEEFSSLNLLSTANSGPSGKAIRPTKANFAPATAERTMTGIEIIIPKDIL